MFLRGVNSFKNICVHSRGCISNLAMLPSELYLMSIEKPSYKQIYKSIDQPIDKSIYEYSIFPKRNVSKQNVSKPILNLLSNYSTELFSTDVNIVEVSPRDGLQNVKKTISTEDKKTLINKLVGTGITNIEATSFVSSKAIPQLADSEEIVNHCHQLKRYNDLLNFSVLVPNGYGFNKARSNSVSDIAIFTAASETFCKKNIGCTIDESLNRYRDICLDAQLDTNRFKIRGYVSCIAGCPYEGDIDVDEVVRVSTDLINMGCYEVSLGDTIGVGTPEQISDILDRLLEHISKRDIAVHFHDTYGNALDNISVALGKGIRTIDGSVGGLGGCPFAPGSSGNVATEDVVKMLNDKGYYTGIDLRKLENVAEFAKRLVE